jgi:hypothetical protein
MRSPECERSARGNNGVRIVEEGCEFSVAERTGAFQFQDLNVTCLLDGSTARYSRSGVNKEHRRQQSRQAPQNFSHK